MLYIVTDSFSKRESNKTLCFECYFIIGLQILLLYLIVLQQYNPKKLHVVAMKANLQGPIRVPVLGGILSQYLCAGQAAGDMFDRGHNRQRVINMGDRLIWPMTSKGRLHCNG